MLECLFELPWRLSRAFIVDAYVASRITEKQGHRQVCGSRRTGHRLEQLTQTLIVHCVFVKNTHVFFVTKKNLHYNRDISVRALGGLRSCYL